MLRIVINRKVRFDREDSGEDFVDCEANDEEHEGLHWTEVLQDKGHHAEAGLTWVQSWRNSSVGRYSARDDIYDYDATVKHL
jgi:hypothetical protein